MKKHKPLNIFVILVLVACMVSCTHQKRYTISGIQTGRIAVDSSWDSQANPELVKLVNNYKSALDNQMDVEIGTAARTMKKGRPQSLLGNFTADALKKRAEKEWGHIDFAIVNTGGLRATMNKGPITIGSVYEIYSFDNTMVLLELPAPAVEQFFKHIASVGGQGLSGDVEVIVKNRKLTSLKIGGRKLDPDKMYRIATLDYLAEGNDGMTAFTKATTRIDSPVTLRDVMLDYIKEQTANNIIIDAKLDDRITVDP